jgi:hypothetical protein
VRTWGERMKKEKIEMYADLEEEHSPEMEFEYDMVRGSHGKKPKMAILNKKQLSSHEMDELFLDF